VPGNRVGQSFLMAAPDNCAR